MWHQSSALHVNLVEMLPGSVMKNGLNGEVLAANQEGMELEKGLQGL